MFKNLKTFAKKKEIIYLQINGTLAQLVEQRTENPCVPGSIPGGTTLIPYFTQYGILSLFIFSSSNKTFNKKYH